jgi:hypothetical protein
MGCGGCAAERRLRAEARRIGMALLSLSLAPAAWADYKTDVGYAALLQELGSAIPDGSGVAVTQTEASSVDTTSALYPIYAPDAAHAAFAGKNFSYPGTASTEPSSHATGVGQLFYGTASMAAGISDIASHETDAWIASLYSPTGTTTAVTRRIANHSWVGNADTAGSNGMVLRVVDRQVQRNEYIQVVGMANGASVNPLLGNGYNVIAVGRSDGGHDRGSDAIDSTYVGGRTRPDLVAPQATTSSATPIVAASAALLVQTGRDAALSLSNGSTTIAGIGTVYNAERAETVKAALMAGASRETANSGLAAEISDYRAGGHQTDNGLDDRYGAGQVNVYNSYHILAAGEQDSLQDGGTGIGIEGFDYDPSFGGASASNATATYGFTAPGDLRLTATLAWNLGVANTSAMTTTLHNLDLDLFDATTQSVVASSYSGSDNTENLWVQLFADHQYQLRVTTPETAGYTWDYALAWRMEAVAAPVPVPAAAWLFASACGGLGLFARSRARRVSG